MPKRKIIPEIALVHEKESKKSTQQQPLQDDGSSKEIIIESYVLEELFKQWIENNKGDLVIDTNLVSEIKKFIDLQNKLIELAEKELEKFVKDESIGKKEDALLYINMHKHPNCLALDDRKFTVYNDDEKGCWMLFSEFKCILLKMNASNVIYSCAYINQEKYINVKEWCLSKGIHFQYREEETYKYGEMFIDFDDNNLLIYHRY